MRELPTGTVTLLFTDIEGLDAPSGCAADAQDALASGSVRVRMGVHTGEPMVTEEGYVGTDVHRAARIMRGEHERAGRLWGTIETEMVGAPNGGWIRHRAAYEARDPRLDHSGLRARQGGGARVDARRRRVPGIG